MDLPFFVELHQEHLPELRGHLSRNDQHEYVLLTDSMQCDKHTWYFTGILDVLKAYSRLMLYTENLFKAYVVSSV